MVKIFLTRHGETLENKEGRFQGHLPGTLSEKGIDQAKKLAERLKNDIFDQIISSDLARAADTAKEIAKFHQNIPINFVEEIRERNLGELQGILKEDLGLDPKQLVAGTIESKEGENQKQMFERANKFMDKLIKEFPNKTILLVAHNGINMALATAILGGSFEDYLKAEKQDNCAVSIYNIEENGKKYTELFNCIKHLN